MWNEQQNSWRKPSRRHSVVALNNEWQAPVPVWNLPLERIMVAIVATFPFWFIFAWITGLTLFAILFTSLVSVLVFQSLTRLEVAVLVTAGCLLLGVLTAIFIGKTEGRASSSIYHLIHWGFFLAFMHFGMRLTQMPDRDAWFKTLSKSAFVSFAIMIVYMMVGAWLVASNPTTIQFPSLVIGQLAGSLNILDGYSMINVTKVNSAAGGSELRLIGYGLWTSEGAYIAVILGLLAIPFAFSRLGIWAVILIEIGVIFAVGLTGSRTTILAFVLSMGFWLLLAAPLWRAMLVTLAPIAIFSVLFFVFGGHEILFELIRKASEARQASSGTRYISYLTAWEMTLSHNPLTGLGYTPIRLNLIHVPVGSHSSWTSLFIRGGFLAVFGFIWIYVLLAGRLAAVSLNVFQNAMHGVTRESIPVIILSRAVLVTLISWVTEDLDGPAAGIAFAGLVIGLLWRWNYTETQSNFVNSSLSRWR